jgi:hypothetical protein
MNEEPQPFMNRAGDMAQNLGENAKNMFANSPNKMSVIIGLAFVILLCFVVALALYWLVARTIFNQSKVIIQQTKMPVLGNKYTKIGIEKYNKSGNGKRRTYTFWIYINDLNKFSGSYKHVFHIGDADNIIKGSPYVFLDKYENKLYARFASVSETDDTFKAGRTTIPQSVQNLNEEQFTSYMRQGIQIPYIPLQRWVHVALVINENTNGGTITAYVDGDISKIVSTQDMSGSGTSSVTNVNKLDLDKIGELHVGGAFDSPLGPGFSGLISKVTMYNYDLNNKDIYADYNDGPLDGLLASLGLSNYGIRSPIYRIS